jgi:hypothetical protein
MTGIPGWGPERCRRGIALPLALFALSILGMVVGAILWAAIVERQAGENTIRTLKARQAADAVWPAVLDLADSIEASAPRAGDSLILSARALPGRASARMTVHRLGPRLLLLHAVGLAHAVDGAIVARHEVEVLVMIDSGPPGSSSSPAPSTPWILTPVLPPFWSALPRID